MRLKTVLKEIDKILELYNQSDKNKKKKAIVRLIELRNRIALKVQEEEKKKENKNPDVAELTKWYLEIWEKKIPEGNISRAGKVFKELLESFSLSVEDIKETYSWWIKLKKEDVPYNLRKTYSIILTAKDTRSITDFKGKLRYIKGLKKELEGNQNRWVSDKFRYSDDTYQSKVISADEIDVDDDIPF